jgi:hypothetical protein
VPDASGLTVVVVQCHRCLDARAAPSGIIVMDNLIASVSQVGGSHITFTRDNGQVDLASSRHTSSAVGSCEHSGRYMYARANGL